MGLERARRASLAQKQTNVQKIMNSYSVQDSRNSITLIDSTLGIDRGTRPRLKWAAPAKSWPGQSRGGRVQETVKNVQYYAYKICIFDVFFLSKYIYEQIFLCIFIIMYEKVGKKCSSKKKFLVKKGKFCYCAPRPRWSSTRPRLNFCPGRSLFDTLTLPLLWIVCCSCVRVFNWWSCCHE